jgi:hypothetical protein
MIGAQEQRHGARPASISFAMRISALHTISLNR